MGRTSKELREAGICTRCKRREAAPGKSLCQECLDYARNWYHTMRSQGRCVHCGVVVPSKQSRCGACKERNLQYGKRRKDVSNESD